MISTMEVVCNLDDVARVLADDGYNITDDSCFTNATDLPSMFGALDSPDSFPESPCSDEDIARVLDITRMTSPLLLESSTRDSISSHLSSPSSAKDFATKLGKTRDPCIANAVLQNSILNSFVNFPSKRSHSPDIFSIALNCPLTDDTSQFNTFGNVKDSDVLSNYFNSSSALSPLSEPDSILPNSSEGFPKCLQQISHHNYDIGLENHHQVTLDLSPNNGELCENEIDNNIDVNCPTKNQVISQTKRKRRRKNGNKAPKSKKRKQDNVNTSKKTKQQNNTKASVDYSHTLEESNVSSYTPTEKTTKRQSSHKGRKRPAKTKNDNRGLQNIAETSGAAEGDKAKVLEGNGLENKDGSPAEIGSTNGVISEQKTLRRSSRATKNAENYNFRLSSLVKRVETERKQQEPRQPKDKTKPPPLSKYRRRTANARERDRMKEINDAFELLRNTLPEMEPEENKQKITKFTILKLALNYISSLEDILENEPGSPPSMSITPKYIDDYPTQTMQPETATVSMGGNSVKNGMALSTEINEWISDNNNMANDESNVSTGNITSFIKHDTLQENS